MAIQFEIFHTDRAARCGRITTPHGSFETPAFMPVGTNATVKALTPEEIKETHSEIILGNAYHLYLRPGQELVARMGGLHRFMNWDGPILTDSGGFQVYSLAPLRQITEEGVTFQSHIDGSRHHFTPESVMQLENNLGADIIMCFDECTPYPVTFEYAAHSVDMTTRWAERCRNAHQRQDQALFGIVQGGVFRELREKSARDLIDLDFPGYAIGGLMIGEDKAMTWDTCKAVCELLPPEKPHYLMGVGTPEDFLDGILRGVDMFDCVIPTRLARNGHFLTWNGRISIKQVRYREDVCPPDPNCPCYCCRHYSRAYLRHLFQAGEILASRLATVHNLTFFQAFMRRCREEIQQGTFTSFYHMWFTSHTEGPIPTTE
ncbi:MAG: tRNA guanosine(34) transglycosylase Tgt [bacterium]|jgi:queuine tRNA-ribosyltransferase|nr:tRNA guanosine(34) transglycosylase Tgt [bacterium]